MQFKDESFDAIIDKGGLDALMEPELGPKLGNQYLSKVSRNFFFCLYEEWNGLIGNVKLT